MLNGLDLTWPWNPGVLTFLIVFSLLYVLGLWKARQAKQPQYARHVARARGIEISDR